MSFLVIFIGERKGWTVLTGLILSGISIMIALGAIMFGAILMIKEFSKSKDDKRKGE